MTSPFTPVAPHEEATRDRSDFLPWARCRNRLLLVRPLKYQPDGFVTQHKPDGTDVVFCDVALLTAIPEAENEIGEKFPAFAAGTQFRNQAVMPGYLKGTFKRYLDKTLIGTVYFGPITKGKPPIMWQDLSGNAEAVAQGQAFLAAHPEFLVPVITPTTEAAPGWNADPWNKPAAPAAAVAVVATATEWANPAPTSPAPASALNTLDQLKLAAAGVNHQGQPQQGDPPF